MSSQPKNSASLCAVGSYASILPFKAIGLEVFVVTDENIGETGAALRRFERSGCAALFLEERLFEKFADLVNELNEASDMSVVPIPGQGGSTGVGLSSLRRSVERAVGMDIFAKN